MRAKITTSEIRTLAKKCGVVGYEGMTRKMLFESLDIIRLYYTHSIINLRTYERTHFGNIKEMSEFAGLSMKEIREVMRRCVVFKDGNGELCVIVPYV